MYRTVSKFFALNHHLALPGIGNFGIETTASHIDFTDRTISPSKHKIFFSNEKLPAEKKFFEFVAHEMKVDEVQAVRNFTDFISQLQNKLTGGENIYLKGIGTISQQAANNVNFQPEQLSDFSPAVTAERIIRKNVKHTVLVGEQEKSSDEMQAALLQQDVVRKEKWWIAAVILAAVGIAAIVFYYALHK